MFDNLPAEMIAVIFRELDPSDLLNCALVSKRCLSIAEKIMPRLKTIRISMTNCPIKGGVEFDNCRLQVCQCESHASGEVLRSLLPKISQGSNSFELDDELVHSRISDEQMAILFAFYNNSELKRLSLSKCDLMNVQPWTLALMARFDQLEKIEMDGCLFSISESVLLRSLSTSFKTLTNVDIRDTKQIGDKFSRSISRNCPNLEIFRISGCSLASTFSVLAMIESTFYRVKHLLTVHMEGTLFSADQLHKYMISPLFTDSDSWKLIPLHVQLGYEKPAVLAENRMGRCVLVYI